VEVNEEFTAAENAFEHLLDHDADFPEAGSELKYLKGAQC